MRYGAENGYFQKSALQQSPLGRIFPIGDWAGGSGGRALHALPPPEKKEQNGL
jgi:hypothetical protein